MKKLATKNSNKYLGKTISHFEDEQGTKLECLHLCELLVIVFDDGTKITLGVDVRGVDEYISQYENEEG